MQLAAVVIVYYPNKAELIKNINSYLPYIDQLYIIDNTPGESIEHIIKEISRQESILYVPKFKNVGVASALNDGVKQAIKDGFTWLLTMDQDSFFEENEIKNYIKYFNKHFKDRSDVAIVCPMSDSKLKRSVTNDYFEPVLRAITSGSLVQLDICKKLNGFKDKLFIDEVDFEYCYRCILNGYKVYEFKNIHLNHNLGINKEIGFFNVFNRSRRVLHTPTRVYYMVRNHFYVYSKYSKYFPEELKMRRKQLLVSLKNNLIFSGNFLKVFYNIIRGYLHFRLNKFS